MALVLWNPIRKQYIKRLAKYDRYTDSVQKALPFHSVSEAAQGAMLLTRLTKHGIPNLTVHETAWVGERSVPVSPYLEDLGEP